MIEQRGDRCGDFAWEGPPGQIAVAAVEQDVIKSPGMGEQVRGRQLSPADRNPQWCQQATPALVSSFAAVDRYPLHVDVVLPVGQDLMKQTGLANAIWAENKGKAATPLRYAVKEVVEFRGLLVPAKK